MQNTAFPTKKTLNLNGQILDLSIPRVMGILNVTPDSFFDGGRYTNPKHAMAQVKLMIEAGADIIDVGGYSTRPGAENISSDEELSRVLPVLQQIKTTFPSIPVSIDTFRSSVAKEAIAAGVCMVNDISGGSLDPGLWKTIASLNVPYVLMHMRGTPETMASMNTYGNIVVDLLDYFQEKISVLRSLGMKDIVIDPGFGFAKNPEQNFMLLKSMSAFEVLGCPILAGLSRKSMIWKTLSIKPEEAGNGTTALNTIALEQGASILRVHDVKETVEVIRLMRKINPTI